VEDSSVPPCIWLSIHATAAVLSSSSHTGSCDCVATGTGHWERNPRFMRLQRVGRTRLQRARVAISGDVRSTNGRIQIIKNNNKKERRAHTYTLGFLLSKNEKDHQGSVQSSHLDRHRSIKKPSCTARSSR